MKVAQNPGSNIPKIMLARKIFWTLERNSGKLFGR